MGEAGLQSCADTICSMLRMTCTKVNDLGISQDDVKVSLLADNIIRISDIEVTLEDMLHTISLI